MNLKIIKTTFLLILFVSCGNSVELKENPYAGFQGQFPVQAIDFDTVKSRVLGPSCTKCHKRYDNYEVVFEQKDRILSAVISGRMPKNAPALDGELVSVLQSWIDAGAPRGRAVEEEEEVLEPTWESLNKFVFSAKCSICHNPDGQASFLDLNTKDKFFEQKDELLNNFERVRESYLIEVLTSPDEPMPPTWSDLERLSEKEIEVIIKWIENKLP